MIVVNFSHPLTLAQVARAEVLTGHKVERVTEVRAHFDHEQAFVPQTRALAALLATEATPCAQHGEQGDRMADSSGRQIVAELENTQARDAGEIPVVGEIGAAVAGKRGRELQGVRCLDFTGGAEVRRSTENGPVQLDEMEIAAASQERLIACSQREVAGAIGGHEHFKQSYP